MADDCKLISHETLQHYVNDLGMQSEDILNVIELRNHKGIYKEN